MVVRSVFSPTLETTPKVVAPSRHQQTHHYSAASSSYASTTTTVIIRASTAVASAAAAGEGGKAATAATTEQPSLPTLLGNLMALTDKNASTLYEQQLQLFRYKPPLLPFEILCHLVATASLLCFLALFWPSRLFHTNLRWVNIHAAMTGVFVILWRFAEIIYRTVTPSQDMSISLLLVFLYVYAFGLHLCFGTLLGIVIERMFATFLVRDYENTERLWIFGFIALLVYSLSAVCVSLIIANHTLGLVIILMLIMVVVYLIFLWLLRHNRRRYASSSEWALRVRFQIAENIRVLRLFHILLIAMSSMVMIALVYFIIMTVLQQANIGTFMLGMCIIFDSSATSMPIIWVWRFPQLWIRGKQRLSCITRIFRRGGNSFPVGPSTLDHQSHSSRSSPSNPVVQLKTIDGTAMVLEGAAATKHYFSLYQKQWNIDDGRKTLAVQKKVSR